jgi:hypothetical protein
VAIEVEITDKIRAYYLSEDEKAQWELHHKKPVVEQTIKSQANTENNTKGPGNWLHIAILRWVGEGPTRKCGCEDRIAQMNEWGPTGCREHLDEIVGWLVEQAEKHGWEGKTPKLARLARFMASKVPGGKIPIAMVCKRMVLWAIRKAENQSKLSSSVPSQQLPISSAVETDGNAGKNISVSPNL